MSEEASNSKLRKGTKSCSECRRRKVRCVWTSDLAQACRRCEEKGSVCIPQTRSIPASGNRKLSSRERISRLEGQVGHLSKLVRGLEHKLGDKLSDTADLQFPSDAHENAMRDLDGDDDYGDYEDDQSSTSDLVAEDRPSHLYSLFQNEMLSTDNSRNVQEVRQSCSKVTNQLLNSVKSALRPLIPREDDVLTIANHVSQWHTMLFDIFPLPGILSSRKDVLDGYKVILEPDADPMALASWMLGVSMISQQVPQEAYSPDSIVKGLQKKNNFARMVSDAVDNTIMSHYSLLGTVAGLQVAMLWLRVQMNWGHLHKTWLSLRKVIAVAELIGLPRVARHNSVRELSADGKVVLQEPKASLWNSICSVERVASILHNFPCATQRYTAAWGQALVQDGVVHPAAYLLRLSNLAIKIQELDELNFASQSSVELYAAVLKIDAEMRLLENEIPQQWWVLPERVETAHLLQFWHSCIGMRMHIPFTLRTDPEDEFAYSKHAGLRACLRVAELWALLRRVLPLGFFICRVIDLQAFTAGIVLMLACIRARRGQAVGVKLNVADMQHAVEKVMELMDERSKDPIGADIAGQAVTAMRSLSKLLSEETNSGALELTVPLLGKVHVKRNAQGQQTAQQSSQQSQLPQQPESLPHHRYPMWQATPFLSSSNNNGLANNLSTNDAPTQDSWMIQDPLSWFIEDNNETVFQDNLLAEDFGGYGYTSFPIPMDFASTL